VWNNSGWIIFRNSYPGEADGSWEKRRAAVAPAPAQPGPVWPYTSPCSTQMGGRAAPLSVRHGAAAWEKSGWSTTAEWMDGLDSRGRIRRPRRPAAQPSAEQPSCCQPCARFSFVFSTLIMHARFCDALKLGLGRGWRYITGAKTWHLENPYRNVFFFKKKRVVIFFK